MKQVVIVRHGKAVPYGYEDDFYSRFCANEVKKDARRISDELKKRSILPDKIISSPAKRAFKTAMIFAENLNYRRQDIITVEDIYDGLTTEDFLELIRLLPPDVNTVFFFGHNPGFLLLCV